MKNGSLRHLRIFESQQKSINYYKLMPLIYEVFDLAFNSAQVWHGTFLGQFQGHHRVMENRFTLTKVGSGVDFSHTFFPAEFSRDNSTNLREESTPGKSIPIHSQTTAFVFCVDAFSKLCNQGPMVRGPFEVA
jgi:hypothetical protein